MTRTGRWAATLVGALVVCGVALPAPSGAFADEPEPVRILLLGDSITQGSNGDWTWRYRLWQHLTQHDVAVDLVGPRDDLHDYLTDQNGNDEYVDPAFDRDHASRWGMTLAAADTPVGQLVGDHAPDVLVEMLGANDLTFLGRTPAEVAGDAEDLVAAARAVDPQIDVVLGTVPQPWSSSASELNSLLAVAADALDTEDARVVLADTASGLDQYEDTFDGTHPNSHGELRIAAAVEDALSEIGAGPPADRPIPDVPRGPRIPPVLSATGTTLGAQVSWVRSPGSTESELYMRDVTAQTAWQAVDKHVPGTSYAVTGLPAWHEMEFQTRPFKGFWGAAPDALSNIASVEVVGDALEASTALHSVPMTGDRAKVTWTAVTHATTYTLQWRALGGADPWHSVDGVAGTSTVVTGLPGPDSYEIRVRGQRGDLEGAWSPVSVFRQVPTRILLLGDSITQGSAGDWTWRYRLWQHLTGDAVSFDLVGYRDDLRDEIEHTFGNQDYLDPAFDRDHASRWGMKLAELDVPVTDLMADHQPDVVVVELGDNDLTAGASAQDVADDLEELVLDARSADPDVDVVLTTDPRPTQTPQASAYNALVSDLVDELDSVDSRVVLADAAAGYDESQDTYDGAHPNSHGELKIAAAVEDALSAIGIGTPADRPLPDIPRGPRIPPMLTATGTPHGAELSWVRSPGAQESEVWLRDVTAGTPWTKVAEGVTGTTYTASGLATGHHVELQTRPFKGFWIAEPDAWSDVEEVVVPPPSRILLLGDSLTIGSTGDHTWRYRLWKHLVATGAVGVDLVGPRDDLYDRATKTYGHQDYVDPAFDRDHAGVWGAGVAFPASPTAQLVTDHDVDTVVELLGHNDLMLLPLTPAQVADEVRGLVEDARSANPDVDVVLGEVVQTWVDGAVDFNTLLHGVAADLDSPSARVVVAETADGFSRLTDTYDDSHPNARGEIKIAAAVADALADEGVGTTYPRPLPTVPVGPRIPVVLRGKVRDGKLVLKWTRSPGADSYKVLIRRPGQGKKWKKAAVTSRRHVTLRGLTPGERVQLIVLPRKGRNLAELDIRSNRVSVRP